MLGREMATMFLLRRRRETRLRDPHRFYDTFSGHAAIVSQFELRRCFSGSMRHEFGFPIGKYIALC